MVSVQAKRQGNSRNIQTLSTCSDNVGCTRFELRLDGVLRSTTAGALTLTNVSRGTHTVTVQGWDAAGNVSPIAYAVVPR